MMVQMATTIGCGIGASNCAEHIENQNAMRTPRKEHGTVFL